MAFNRLDTEVQLGWLRFHRCNRRTSVIKWSFQGKVSAGYGAMSHYVWPAERCDKTMSRVLMSVCDRLQRRREKLEPKLGVGRYNVNRMMAKLRAPTHP